MINEVRISTEEDLKKLFFANIEKNAFGRVRSTYLYRGLNRADYKLETTLQRNCGSKAFELEAFLLRNFKKYVSIINPTVNESDWKAMIVGQHHGLPTRLLDWTLSMPMALHFAVTENNLDDMDKNDCVIWGIDSEEINEKLPKQYAEKAKTNVLTLKELEGIVDQLPTYDRAMGDKSFVIIEPPSIDQRIVNQYSFFSIMPSGITDLDSFLIKNTTKTVKYIIDKNLRWLLRDMLDQWNINERSVYPGIDGIATWLKRYYYAK